VREHLRDLPDDRLRVLVISFGTPESIEGFRARLGLPFPVASDPEQKAYRDYGIGKASFWSVWSPRVLWKYLRLRARGQKLQHSPEPEDVYQLGGDFLLDENGKVLFSHTSRTPVDRPAVRRILEALE
jgi:peroxiredoxin